MRETDRTRIMKEEEEMMLQGQAEIWNHMLAFADSMAIKCAVRLGIADIINTQGRPLSLEEIAERIPSSSPNLQGLARIMRLLVRKRVFAAQERVNGDTVYSLTPASKWLVTDSELNLGPMILMENHPTAMTPWHYFDNCVKEGGIAFEKAHGFGIFEFTGLNPEFNKLFNSAMACSSKIVLKAILSDYREGFEGLSTLVDVGGGIGSAINEIVKFNPNIKGINFDLPHVIATAPDYMGVSHIGGDMFTEVPHADAIFMKWIMHDWSDEDCVKILKNCRKVIPEATGKVIIVDVVLQPEEENPFTNSRLVFDLVMLAHSSGGKERTESEWKKILEEGGFPRYNIISISALPSVIEAFPG